MRTLLDKLETLHSKGGISDAPLELLRRALLWINEQHRVNGMTARGEEICYNTEKELFEILAGSNTRETMDESAVVFHGELVKAQVGPFVQQIHAILKLTERNSMCSDLAC